MDPFIGEIKLMAVSFAPQGWALCNGQTLQINQNQSLYSLLGTQYGGTSTTFNLPDLRGRAAAHLGYVRNGTAGGSETVALTTSQVPAHNHPVGVCTNNANKSGAQSFHIAVPTTTSTPPTQVQLYAAAGGALVALDQASAMPTVSNTGGNMAHDNVQPFLALNYCIATTGVYPTRS